LEETQWSFGIYATNRPTWVIADHAGYAYSLIPIALFDTLGPDVAEFIINHAELQVMVCSADKIHNVLKIAHRCPTLKAIVSMVIQGLLIE
jgi:long-chain acyl-CoA synthetase